MTTSASWVIIDVMKKFFFSALLFPSCILSCCLFLTCAQQAKAADVIEWSDTFPTLPDSHGYAGGFAGIVGEGENRTLVFAGGANFPYEDPFD